MSVPIVNGSVLIPGSVLVASLLGSAHCVGMCGGIVTSSCRGKLDLIQYHLGRLVSYAVLGAVAGALGEMVFENPVFRIFPWLAAALMGFAFASIGLRLWRGDSPHFQAMPQKALSSLYRRATGIPLALGALSAFLPCGWLQSFLLGAAATGGAWRGAIFLAVFWLGTLPALTSAPWILRRIARPFAIKMPKLAGAILIGVALFGIGLKMSTLWASSGSGHCHEMGHEMGHEMESQGDD